MTLAFVSMDLLWHNALGAIPLLGEWPGGLEWTGVALALAGTTIALYPTRRKGVS